MGSDDQGWVVVVGADLVMTSSSTGTSRLRKSATALDTKNSPDTSRMLWLQEDAHAANRFTGLPSPLLALGCWIPVT